MLIQYPWIISLGHWECKSDNLTLNAYLVPKPEIFCYSISNWKVLNGSKHDCYVKLIGTDMSSIILTMDGVPQKTFDNGLSGNLTVNQAFL